MSTNERPDRGAFERWRAHRRLKRQRVLERAYFDHERTRDTGIRVASASTDLLNAQTRSSAHGTIWVAWFGGL